jgi:acyl-CoA reductase-like NAD-dependent aldehyde dehydrogenase
MLDMRVLSHAPELAVLDPATGDATGHIPACGVPEANRVVAAARAAQSPWGRTRPEARGSLLKAGARALREHARELAALQTLEVGMPLHESLGGVEAGIAAFEAYAELGPIDRGRALAGDVVLREPRGVVAIVMPWSDPLAASCGALAAALVTGNTVVLKPSEVTPLVGLEIGRLFADVGTHADVVQVVTGGGATGDALVRSGVQKVAFTGSVRTGKLVMQAAAETLTPVLLELGGKDPMVVCDDADLERAANGAVWGAFMNAGQTCMAVERVYVHDAVYDKFVDLVVEKTRAVRQGTGATDDIGSMSFEPQVEIVERHVNDALAKGARALTGGRRVPGRQGLWYEPTVLVDVDHTMDVMRDETFGPVLPIMAVRDDEEALRLANDSPYGLSSSVWSADAERGEHIAAALQAGNVCVNDCVVNYAVAGLPFGGVKESGIGRVHGVEGLRAFSNVKSVLSNRVSPRREIQWYPVPRWLGGTLFRVLRLRYRRGLAAKVRKP